MKKKAISTLLAVCLALTLSAPALAAQAELQGAVEGAAGYVYQTTPAPQVGSVGGEWAVIGLARSGCGVPDGYLSSYYAAVEEYVSARAGVLSESRNSVYARVILALTAIGRDPTDVAGYNLLTPLGDYDRTLRQGVNGAIWALIALDSGDYEMPVNAGAETQATRRMYVDAILDRRLPDGGWSLTGDAADADLTASALQALSGYLSRSEVSAAAEAGLECLSALRDEDGGYGSCESAAQVIIALCDLGVELDDDRFTKNGDTLLDILLSFRQTDGGFAHSDSGSSRMAGEQALCALVAALRAANGQNGLYSMGDAADAGESGDGGGLPGRHADVRSVPVTSPGATFDDIADSENAAAIEALASRGIITGMGDGIFAPQAAMTRAQFAAIVIRGLGLAENGTGAFSDVPPDRWYAGYVGAASAYGIVNGIGGGLFGPEGIITRQEAAVMTARAAKLCGMDTDMTDAAVSNALAQFDDYTAAADWARGSLAFCCAEGILDDSAPVLSPTEPIRRGELAQMLFNMLARADLI